jgi:hypothetical protein
MSSKILIKRSTTTGAVPTTSDLDTGELAINTVDKKLYTNNSGTIVEIGVLPSAIDVTNNATVGGTLAVTGNTTLSTGSTSGDFSVAGSLTLSTQGTLASHVVTKGYVDSVDTLKLNKAGDTMSGNLAMGSNKVTGLDTPTDNDDAATKGYVDASIADILDGAPAALDTLNELAAAINDDDDFAATVTTALAGKLSLTGGTMTGDIAMGSNEITSSVDPSSNDTLSRKAYVDDQVDTKVSKAGDTLTGNLVMGVNSVTSTANPTTDDELARKGYVDTILGSATEAAASASEAATSASNAANSASSASTSETNTAASEGNAASSATAAAASASAAASSASSASSSASAAATSAASASTSASSAESAWDSLDDRYLGAKASDPTTDNDGNTLLTGAMYFDSTNNVTKVYNGTDWQAASSSIEGIKSDFQYTATASQTLFSGSDDNTNTLVIDKAGLVNVYLNGVRLADSDYTINVAGNSVTLGSGASVGDIVEIEVFGNFAGQSGADVAITGGSITGLTELSTGTFTSTGIDDNATSTAITIDSTGNVGINTSSPDTVLNIENSSNPTIKIRNTTAAANGYTELQFDSANTFSGTSKSYIRSISNNAGNSSTSLAFATNADGGGSPAERMRIDSSGNLLVGTTTTNPHSNSSGSTADNATSLDASGYFSAGRYQGPSMYLNRTGTDGDIAQFRKDGSTVGSIGAEGGDLVIGTGSTAGLQFNDATPTIRPWNMSANTRTDGVCDLGYSNSRFKDLYLSGAAYANYVGSASDTNTNIAFDNADTIRFTNGASERARITSSGTLLVGGSADYGTGRVIITQSADDKGIALADSALSYTSFFHGNSNGTKIGNNHTQPVTFFTNNTEKARIDSSGIFYVGLPTGSNFTRLMPGGGVLAKNGSASDSGVSYWAQSARGADTGRQFMYFQYSNTSLAFQVFNNGNVQNLNNSYGALSDIKLKENIELAESQWDDIKSIEICKYNLKETGEKHIGVIAQQLEEVGVNGLVEESYLRDSDGNLEEESTKSVKYSVLYMKSIKALQEAMERIEQLEQRVDAMENK